MTFSALSGQDPRLALLEFIPAEGQLLLLGPEDKVLFQSSVHEFRRYTAMHQIRLELRSTRTQDPRLMSLTREHWDAIYWDASPRTEAAPFPLEQVQRVLLTCFQALRPARGRLALSASQDTWDEQAIQSLIRQSGFRLLGIWTAEADEEKLWLLQRV